MKPEDRIQIRVTEDGLEAWIAVAEGPAVDRAVLETRLEGARIRAGRDDEAIEGVARALELESAMLQERRIACGLAPRPGRPPVLQLHDPAGPVPGVMQDDGRLDFRERLLILPVAEGDVIGHIEPGRPGEPGWNVHGDPIEPPPVPDLDVKHGDGISIGEDGILRAERKGARTIDPDGRIDVVNLHVHPGHVDLASGNLRTDGSLEVARDVTAGMSVRADVDVRIRGAVDGGNISAGGSVEVAGGVFGREGGRVHAGGDLRVRHALGATLHARGLLTVARSVSTSNLVAREIEVDGRMLSNLAQAETRIRVQDAGSPAGGPCILRVAHPLEAKGSPIDPMKDRPPAPAMHRSPRPIDDLRTRKKRSGPGRRPRPGDRHDRLELLARRDFRRRQRELQRSAVIEIRGIAHAGCRLDFGLAPLLLDRDTRAKSFRIDPETREIVGTEL